MPDDRPHFFAFYPRDFADDLLVEAMTTEQVGAYILLLCKAWQATPPATVPADPAVLAKLARVTPERWAEIGPGVMRPFTPITDTADTSTLVGYVQKRLAAEYEQAKRKIEKHRHQTHNATRQRMQNRHHLHVTSTSRQRDVPRGANVTSASQSQSINTEDKTPYSPPSGDGEGVVKPARKKRTTATSDPLFDRFWAAYPLKAGKAAAAQAFAKLAADEPLLARLLAALAWQVRSERWVKDGGRFIPHAATWLNGRRWEDEPPPAAPAAKPAKETHAEMVARVAAELKAKSQEPADGNA